MRNAFFLIILITSLSGCGSSGGGLAGGASAVAEFANAVAGSPQGTPAALVRQLEEEESLITNEDE